MSTKDLPPQFVHEFLTELDPLMIALGLACAAITPGPPGYAGAVGAIVYDAKHKRWSGIALSAASMIPIVGYLPAAFKIGWLLKQLDRQLKTIESNLAELHQSDETIALLREGLGKYHRSIPKIKLTQTLRRRLEHIMALNDEATSEIASASGNPH